MDRVISPWAKPLMLGVVLIGLAACQTGTQDIGGSDTRVVERDVEAPEVFQVTDDGLWDGRPTLGGVWVAHPTATSPERALIRNTTSGGFVVGALFSRDGSAPGPLFQLSSDAAEALGVAAGETVALSVTALRSEQVLPEGETVDTLPAPAAVSEVPLDAASPLEVASAAQTAEPAPAAAPTPAVVTPRITLTKPFLQIGFYSVEQNARNTGESLRRAGIVPTIKEQTSQGKTFWRVLVGPVSSTTERGQLLKTIKGLGYADAYAVTN